MAITLTQARTTNTTAAASLALSFSSLPAVNSLIVVKAAWFPASSTTITISDNQGNTYTQSVNAVDGGGSVRCSIHWATATTSSGTFTVTVNPSGASDDITIVIEEYAGVTTSSPTDGATNNAGNSTGPTSNTLTPSQANDLLVAVLTHAGTDRTLTEGGGFSLAAEDEGGSAHMPIAGAYKVQTSIVTEGASWTIGTGAVQWVAGIAAFKAAPAAAAVTVDYTTHPKAWALTRN